MSQTLVIPGVDIETSGHIKCTLVNSSGATLELTSDSAQATSEKSVPATTLEDGSTLDFTLSPGDKLVYTIGGSEGFKIVFDEDKDHPKLKLSDALEEDSTPYGVETTKVEVETETETETKTETTKSRTTGKKLPETKKSETTKSEIETGNIKIEKKTETKTKTEKRETKTTVTEETETKKTDITLLWEIYKV